MSWPFVCTVTGGGRGLRVTRGRRPVVEFAFGLPGAKLAGWEADDEEVLFTTEDPFTARLRHLPDEEGWTTVVSLDNTAEGERAIPPLGVAATVAPGWAGWSWTSDTEGFLVVAPASGGGQSLLVTVRRGFWRAAQERPVFAASERRATGIGPGAAAFHLANPNGALRGHGRHQTTLELSAIPTAASASGTLPGWLPDLLVRPGDELRFDTPDQAIVPGPGLELSTLDTSALLVGEPGHREVAVHGVRGVQRVRASFMPAVAPFLADLAAALKSRRPSALPSATGAVVAAALARRTVLDPDSVLDWLEREDWLARGDVFGPAIAAVVATETHDDALLEAACEAVLVGESQPGAGILATRCWLATLRMGLPPLDLSRVFAHVSDDPLAGFEVAVLRNQDADRWTPFAAGLVNRLGAGLPGQPVGLPEADAGLLIALLRLMPEDWAGRRAATEASEKAAGLLLADHADGLHPAYDGLAWLLLGEIGA